MTGLELVGRGRTADVYALDEHRVLRRYRDGGSTEREAEVMTYLGRQGFPVPEVYDAEGPDLVLERLAGDTMIGSLASGAMGLTDGARVLAELHTRLHSVPARRSSDPAVRVLHLDLHPDNVFISSRGPVVIDWRNSTEGPPDLDVAMSALIMAEAAVDETFPGAPAAAMLVRQFLAHADGDPDRELDRAVALRAADTCLDGAEVGRLPRAAALIRAHR